MPYLVLHGLSRSCSSHNKPLIMTVSARLEDCPRLESLLIYLEQNLKSIYSLIEERTATQCVDGIFAGGHIQKCIYSFVHYAIHENMTGIDSRVHPPSFQGVRSLLTSHELDAVPDVPSVYVGTGIKMCCRSWHVIPTTYASHEVQPCHYLGP
ncbi:uncharacterized protein LY79DRAFT_369488 [Colletotrichum navitas]|uniref:Uncharacterized protein n=1 Tax=Colletotrichum navitas TaxID=681940 RepID=A0AAD8PQC0_9PEZI|nr:uncharacterized protein LY79DRAFT_369488 [Colletotrichum navitas]KAK1574307.1 hypothetical protein LY79DRAFT_369488 [Colletotrichum navitas]